jgi:hypothetical protein
MASRSTRITIKNRSDMQFVVSGEGTSLVHGVWSDGGRPEPGSTLLETMDLVIESESDGFATGTEGSVLLTTTLPGGRPFEFYWDNPFAGSNEYLLKQVPSGLDASYSGGEGDNTEVEVTIAPTMMVQTSFRPSTNGWHFSNSSWPSVPNTSINLGLFSIPIGDASNGMCGGMVYSAIDYAINNLPIPPLTSAPAALGDPFFDFISTRLYDSFHLPFGPANTYIRYMSVGFPPAQRAEVTIKDAIPKIRGDIAAGQPSAMGLIGVISDNVIADLGKHHQVLAYSYQRSGPSVTLGIYDPNRPDRDDLTIVIDAENLGAVNLSHNTSMRDIVMFFHTGYAAAVPPEAVR